MEVDVSGEEKVEVESPEGDGEDVPPPVMNIKVKSLLVKKCMFCRRYITKSQMVYHLKTVHPNEDEEEDDSESESEIEEGEEEEMKETFLIPHEESADSDFFAF